MMGIRNPLCWRKEKRETVCLEKRWKRMRERRNAERKKERKRSKCKEREIGESE